MGPMNIGDIMEIARVAGHAEDLRPTEDNELLRIVLRWIRENLHEGGLSEQMMVPVPVNGRVVVLDDAGAVFADFGTPEEARAYATWIFRAAGPA